MEKISLGKSDVLVTPITFGAWAIGGWMWGGADQKEAIDAIEAAIDLGITSIDTAPVYGFGKSEELVGKAIKGKRDRVEILTKYGMNWRSAEGEFFFDSIDNQGKPVKIHRYSSKESVIRECEDSLVRLGTDYIDLLQIHWPDPITPIGETMEAVQILIDQGKIRAAGVSNYDSDHCREASNKILLASNQVPYSMVRRDIEEELVPWCIENDVSILAYSPLQRGLLTGKITPGYKYNSGDSRANLPHFSDENVSRVNKFLDEIKPIAEGKDASLAQLVLAWTLFQPGITVVLAGARNRKQVQDNIGAAELNLSKEEANLITSSLDKLKLDL